MHSILKGELKFVKKSLLFSYRQAFCRSVLLMVLLRTIDIKNSRYFFKEIMVVPSVKSFFAVCQNISLEKWFNQTSAFQRLLGYLALSWVFALGAQVVIPLPFNVVPLVLNPFPLLLAAHFLGLHAVYAYGLYLIQGSCGMPVFLGLRYGIGYLFGPTGGYTLGFGTAMLLLAVIRPIAPNSRLVLLSKFICCAFIYFGCGLAQLWLFVPTHQVLSMGLYPFIIGDACKLLALMIFSARND